MEPMIVTWDREVIHEQDGGAVVCCLAEDGRPVALVLTEELREALGLSLIASEDDDR